jgi:hypothetical protein
VVKLLRNASLPGRILLLGRLSQPLLRLSAKVYQKCVILFRPSPHKFHRSRDPKTTFEIDTSAHSFQWFQQQSFHTSSEPYLSIVVVGHPRQAFLDALGKGLERIPLARVELVVVEAVGEIGPLSSVPARLRGRTRIIQVPTNFSSVGLARNVGIRRAKGRFVLSTSPATILPSDFFELVAAEDFTEGILYRAARWAVAEHLPANFTIDELWQTMGEPWRLGGSDAEVKCAVGAHRLVVANSSQKFLDEARPCGAGDFLLASRQLWDVVWGFTEGPKSADALLLAKFMKLIPGYASQFILPVTAHLKQQAEGEAHNLQAVIEELACAGESKTLGNNYDTHKWGQPGEGFDEILV